MTHLPIILASASPQRKALLKGLGIPFTVVPSSFNEASCNEWDPGKRAVMLAELKAADVAQAHPKSIVIGCDTLVVAPDGTLLEKPADTKEAAAMLCLQSGGTSIVHSGLCVIAPEQKASTALSSSGVTFAKLSEEDIARWIKTGLWGGRSGAFQIDGPGQLMIERIDGDWTSVVGLPVFLLGRMLRNVGVQLMGSSMGS